MLPHVLPHIFPHVLPHIFPHVFAQMYPFQLGSVHCLRSCLFCLQCLICMSIDNNFGQNFHLKLLFLSLLSNPQAYYVFTSFTQSVVYHARVLPCCVPALLTSPWNYSKLLSAEFHKFTVLEITELLCCRLAMNRCNQRGQKLSSYEKKCLYIQTSSNTVSYFYFLLGLI